MNMTFLELNKLQLEDNSLFTPLYGIKAVKEVRIGSDIIFDDKYLVPFYAFLIKTLNKRTLQVVSH
nr:MAG: hypothetical protein OI719_00020 [Candidatus Methanoperedens sp.]